MRKHFWSDLQTGVLEANAKVAQSLFQRATTEKGSAGVTAAIFWLKVRAGWREPTAPTELGKKADRERASETAEQGTQWATLLQ